MNVRHTLLLLPFALAFGCEPTNPIGAASAPQTSRMQISKNGKTLYVALADHDLVRAIDASSGKQIGEVAVDGHPHRLTVLADGRVAVAARYAGTVSIVDVEHGTSDATVEVGSDPFGMVEKDGSLFVAVAGEGDLARIDLKDPTRVAERITLGYDDPRGVALLPDGKIVVSHFTAGHLSIVDGAKVSDVDMHLQSKQFFFPNQMESVTASVDGSDVAVPHVECNNDPAQFGAGGTSLVGAAAPAVTYYVDGPTGYPAVVPAVSHVDPTSGALLSDESRTLQEASGNTPEAPGAASPVINPLDRALLGAENINGVTEIAYVNDGNLELLVARGSGNVFVRRPQVKAGQASLVGVVKLAVGVESIQISPDGTTAYVYNTFDDSVTSFPVPREKAESKFAGGSNESATTSSYDENTGASIISRANPIPVIKTSSTFTVAQPVLSPAAREGRVLYYAADDRLTKYGAISCQSCHPGGGDDGTTWHFAEGPRQSPALWGGITGTEPFHWDNTVANMAGISDATIVTRMGGSGLPASDMDKIGAFLDGIPAPAAPSTADLTSIARGADLFFGEATGCTQCHAGAAFSDNQSHDVGTGRGEPGGLRQFATPVLHGLSSSAPYLHDGSARTLKDVVEKLVVTDKMGHGSQLTSQDQDDLVAFLRSL